MKKILLAIVAILVLTSCHKHDKNDNQLFIYGYDKVEKQGNKAAYYTEQKSVKEIFSENDYLRIVDDGMNSTWTWRKDIMQKADFEIDTYYDPDEERIVFNSKVFDYGWSWDDAFWLKAQSVLFCQSDPDGVTAHDTLGYIPFSERNSVYERVRAIVEREGEITDECYDIWNATMHFYPITGAEYRAQMARGEY